MFVVVVGDVLRCTIAMMARAPVEGRIDGAGSVIGERLEREIQTAWVA